MGSQCQQHRVILFGKSGKVADPAIGLHGYASIVKVGGFPGHYLTGQTISGNAIGHLSAQGGIGFLQNGFMTLFRQIIGGCHTGRAAAHHTYPLSGGGKVFAVLLPKLVVRVLGGIALDVANGNRIVDISTAAFALAGMGAHPAQTFREGQPLMHHGQRLTELTLFDKAHISRHIGAGRTGGLTGNQGILFLDGGELCHIPDGTGGTYLGAGTAEPAVGVFQKLVMECSHIGFQLFFVILQRPYAPQVVTGPDAPAAQHTAVHIVDQQGVLVVLGKPLTRVFIRVAETPMY